jgi:hypothetical protein
MDDRQPIEATAGNDMLGEHADSAGSLAVAADVTSTAHADSSASDPVEDTRAPAMREEQTGAADAAPVPMSFSSDSGLPPLEQQVQPVSSELADASAPPVAATIVAVEETLDQMHHLLEEVRTTMSDPTNSASELVDSICDEEKLHAHAPELDQLLNEFLSNDAPTEEAAASIPSADEALAAVESAMSALTDASTTDGATPAEVEANPEAMAPTESAPEPTPEPAADEPQGEAGAVAEAVEPPASAATEAQAEAPPEAHTEAQPEPEPTPEPTPAVAAAPEPEPVVAVAAAVAVAASAAPTPAPATPAPAAPATPKVPLITRVRSAVGAKCSAVNLAARSVLTGFATIVPAKLRMIVGVVAATLLLWVPVVWMMAKTIAANDRIRPLTEIELHQLIESTHASEGAASGGGHEAKKEEHKEEKKSGGHEEKKPDKKAEKKPAGEHEAKKEEKKPEKKAEKKPDKKAEHKEEKKAASH